MQVSSILDNYYWMSFEQKKNQFLIKLVFHKFYSFIFYFLGNSLTVIFKILKIIKKGVYKFTSYKEFTSLCEEKKTHHTLHPESKIKSL